MKQYLRKISVVIASETQRSDFALFGFKCTIRKGRFTVAQFLRRAHL